MTPNTDLAYAVLDHIDAHPDAWDQRHWLRSADNECGTVACFAGWACLLAGHTARELDYADGPIREVAARELGIEGLEIPCLICGSSSDCDWTIPVSDALFAASLDRLQLGDAVHDIFGPRPATQP